MADRYLCYNCEKTEDLCKCEKYCALCQDTHQVRLCQDGQYYCIVCREACDYTASA